MAGNRSMDTSFSVDERKGQILKTVVNAYVGDPNPVGSRVVSETSALDVSPATIRNEMHALEVAGYLMHPHTSSGRIPTDLGYRYFVDNFVPADHSKQKTRGFASGSFPTKSFLKASGASEDRVFEQAVLLLSTLTKHTAVLVKETSKNSDICDVHISKLADGRLVVALFFEDSTIQRIVVDVDSSNDSDVEDCLTSLKLHIIGKSIQQLIKTPFLSEDTPRDAFELSKLILQACLSAESVKNEEASIHIAGAANIANPESPDGISAEMIALLEKQMLLVEMIRNSVDESIIAKIGSENEYVELSNHSMVLAPFVSKEGDNGTIGIIGPTRMDYLKVFTVLNSATDALTKVLDQ